MIKCPNCKEAIGDDISTCPFCRHEITDHERMLIEKELKEELLSSRTEMSEEVAEWSARRKRWVIISLVLILVFGLSALLIIALPFDDHMTQGYIFLVLIILAFAVSMISWLLGFFTHLNRCPHCGRYLYRQSAFRTEYCRFCGNRIT